MTLTVDGHPLYYRRAFYQGYGSETFDLGAVIYQDGVLTECGATAPQDHKPAGVLSACENVSARLTGGALTDPGKSAFLADTKRADLAGNVSQACGMLREEPRLSPESLDVVSEIGDFSEYSIDIDNDGQVDRVIRLGGSSVDCVNCGNNYFRGSFLLVFPAGRGNPDAAVDFLRTQKGASFDLETIPGLKQLSDNGGYVVSDTISGASIRYIFNRPFESGGKTYIYSFTANREQIPPASISQVLPDHSLKTICKFDKPQES